MGALLALFAAAAAAPALARASSGSIAPAPPSEAKLRELSLLQVYAEREISLARAHAADRERHSIAGFAGLVAGAFVGVITLNPKAGLAAMQTGSKLAAEIAGTDDDELRERLTRYRGYLQRIAALEQELGLEPGVSKDRVKQLLLAASKRPGGRIR